MKIWKMSGGKKINWEDVDWSKGTSQIAREKQTSPAHVWKVRLKLAPETISENKDYSTIDWAKNNEQIVSETHIPIRQIIKLRKKFAPETVGEYYGKNTDWNSVDWSKSTSELSDELGVAISTVSNFRSKYAPHTLKYTPSRKFDWNSIDWNKSNRDIAYDLISKLIDEDKIDENGLTQSYLLGLEKSISARRARYAPETKTKHTNWADMEWNKSNNQLAQENGLTREHIFDMRKKYAPHTMPSYQGIEETVTALSQSWYKIAQNNTDDIDKKYPLASNEVDGLSVLSSVPNTSSISASLTDYYILKGIRVVPMSDFDVTGRGYSVDEDRRIKQLEAQIKQSKTISPLIVVVEKQGPYVLEGSHRLDALYNLKIQHLPALVVIDTEGENP